MYKKILDFICQKPDVYARSTAPFWDDPHISKGMLEAHLAFDVEAASRKYDFIVESVNWIKNQFLDEGKDRLLDLGCGPGLYTELFCQAGFAVTGIDYSRRSIEYAIQSAGEKGLPIEYFYKNYLDLDYENCFDVVTLIYCDFGVLSPSDRRTVLAKANKALKPGGTLILDGFTEVELNRFKEGRTAEYYKDGFWAPYPYLCIQSNYLYPDTANYLEQYVILSENECQCYNNWNQIFCAESLTAELCLAGFQSPCLYDDVSGRPFTAAAATVCAAAKKSTP